MADQQETIELNDAELFQGAVAEEPERARDEQGRFAAKEPEVEAKPEPEKVEAKPEPVKEQQQPEAKDAKDEAAVPSWRLREVGEARQAAERRAEEAQRQTYALNAQLQQMQNELAQLRKPKEEATDFFVDPDKALQQRLSPVEERFAKLETEMRLNSSKALAVAMHGAPAIAEMEKAVEQAAQANNPDIPALAEQMRRSHDPVGVAMAWHQRSKLISETGGDIGKYKERILGEAMKDPAFLKQALEAARSAAGQQSSPAINLPPSLNKTAGSAASAPDDGDVSDAALFRQAVRR